MPDQDESSRRVLTGRPSRTRVLPKSEGRSAKGAFIGSSTGQFVTQKFETCPGWGANLTPLFSTYPLLTTRLGRRASGPRSFQSLPVLTQIYPNFPANPPNFPPVGRQPGIAANRSMTAVAVSQSHNLVPVDVVACRLEFLSQFGSPVLLVKRYIYHAVKV